MNSSQDRNDPSTWRALARQLRVDAIRATTAAGSGHPSSAMSAADLMAVLLARHMRHDFDRPEAARSRLAVEAMPTCGGPEELLRKHGYRARRADDGLPGWRLSGMPVAVGAK
jgi:hypothetical protein